MAIDILSTVPQTDDEWHRWHFAHQAHHRDINDTVQKLFIVYFPQYVLDPVDPSESSAYSFHHQQMHNNQDALLGLPQFDLSSVDWSDRASVAAFVEQNFNLHLLEAQALGID